MAKGMTKDEAIERIKTGNFCGKYGFDLQILIGCFGMSVGFAVFV